MTPAAALPIDTLTRAQISVILALETVLQAAGLILTCPRCAADGFPRLKTDNDPKDLTWTIDCRCRQRRVSRSEAQPMSTSGDLLRLTPELLSPISLAVRCPSSPCLLTPLEMHPTPEGLLVTCRCGRYQFRKTNPLH